MKLGIDIGRVIIAPDAADRGDTSFIGGTIENALATPPCDGVFDVLPEIVQYFHGRVWLVSKARKSVQEKTRRWLIHQRFFERTGIATCNLRFCLERADKAEHCRELGITHFIDDRQDVLQHMSGIVAHRYLFGPQRDAVPPELVHVESWHSVLSTIGKR
jgi:hypothetical protein